MIPNAIINANILNLTVKCYQQIYIYSYTPCPLLPWPHSYIYLSSDTTVKHHVLLFPCFIVVLTIGEIHCLVLGEIKGRSSRMSERSCVMFDVR